MYSIPISSGFFSLSLINWCCFCFYLYVPLILKMPRAAKNKLISIKNQKELVTIESKTDELTWCLS